MSVLLVYIPDLNPLVTLQHSIKATQQKQFSLSFSALSWACSLQADLVTDKLESAYPLPQPHLNQAKLEVLEQTTLC